MTHSFQRYTAAGNTFVVMNTWEDPLSISREEMRALVRIACDYKSGIGADGVILVNQPAPSPGLSPVGGEEKSKADFRMDFYNPDGSTGMLCGNGARCAVEAAWKFGFVTSDRSNFEVLGAINHAEILPDGNIRVFFQDPTVIRLNFELPVAAGFSLRGGEDDPSAPRSLKAAATIGNVIASYVDLGSQHVVVFFEELKPFGETSIEEFDIARFGPLLRWHPEFAPVGANANFIEVREDGEEKYLRIRTFERGVEGETLACGTGCMSAAIVARMTGRIPLSLPRRGVRGEVPIRLLTQSGEFVTVNFKVEGDRISNLSLEGSVVQGEEGTFEFNSVSNSFTTEYL